MLPGREVREWALNLLRAAALRELLEFFFGGLFMASMLGRIPLAGELSFPRHPALSHWPLESVAMSVHVTLLKAYVGIVLALMVCTAVTVMVASVNLGQLNKAVALGIASLKATLVVLYFMHVKYASRLTELVVVSGFFFLAILLGLTMSDYGSGSLVNPPAILQSVRILRSDDLVIW
jgi:cytochrome c oxidase subunit 4